jgi:hypothetical protein
MFKKYIIPILLWAILLTGAHPAVAAEVYGPNVKLRNGHILVTTGLNLDPQSIEDIKKGVSKDIVFYIDLFRGWNNWPDEFVLGITVAQTLRCDPVKKEFIALSKRGGEEVTKRFESCDELINWTMSLPDEKLTSTAELRPETPYYVKTTVESRLRRLPSFFRLLFFFVKETEFKMEAESKRFTINEKETQ